MPPLTELVRCISGTKYVNLLQNKVSRKGFMLFSTSGIKCDKFVYGVVYKILEVVSHSVVLKIPLTRQFSTPPSVECDRGAA
jgi:hypothetical protein